MVRKKAKPISHGNLDIDPEVEQVLNAAPSEQLQYVIISTDDSSDNFSEDIVSDASSDCKEQRPARASTARPQVKRGRHAVGGAAASRSAALSRNSASSVHVIVLDSSDTSDDENAAIVKQIWSFAHLTFDHEDFSFLQKHFDPCSFCIAFAVVDVHVNLLPAINVDDLGYCPGIVCEISPEVKGRRFDHLHFTMRSSSGVFACFPLKVDKNVSELSSDVLACIGRGLITFAQGIWSSSSSRFIFPLALNLDALSDAHVNVRKSVFRVMAEYRPQQFLQSDEENSQPLPVDQILEFICRRPDEYVEPPVEFATPVSIPGVSTCLKGYQREAVAWARCVESGAALARNGRDLVTLPVKCSITQREVFFDPVLCQIAAPLCDSEQFKVSGGMICDEMGLGKTLECLALVILTRNSCSSRRITPSAEHILPQSHSLNPESDFRCVCGQNDLCSDEAVQCENCLYWLHVKCVASFDPVLPYFCLSCRSHVRAPLQSDCTLIISPSSICGQVQKDLFNAK